MDVERGPQRPQPGAAAGSDLGDARILTYLVADIRGYTRFTDAFGDEAASRLAERLGAAARNVVAERGGAIVGLRGDEVVAVFASARAAVRAAVDLQGAVADAQDGVPGLPLGIGVDAGEAVSLTDNVAGGVLNVASRLCAAACGGDVLASATVVSLARAVDDVRYERPRRLRLKGLAEAVDACAVRPAGAPPPAVPPLAPDPPRRGRRRALAAAGAACAALAAAAWVARDDPAPSLAPDMLVRFAPDGGVTGRMGFDGGPIDIAPDGESAWAVDATQRSVWRIEPDGERRGAARIGGLVAPGGAAVAFGAVWVADGARRQVVRVDGERGVEIARIAVGNTPWWIAAGAGAVWVSIAADGTVARIDPATNGVERFAVGGSPGPIAVADGAAWVVDTSRSTVLRIQSRRTITAVDVGEQPVDIAAGEGAVWTADAVGRTVTRVSYDGDTTPISVEGVPTAVAAGGGALWIGTRDGRVLRLGDDGAGAASVVATGAAGVRTLAWGEGGLWASTGPGLDAHTGGTLRVVAGEGIATTDPAMVSTPAERGLVSLVHRGLVGYRRVGGPAGFAVVADLAVALPEQPPRSRTYTFRLRQGLRYANGAPVRASDLRRALLRLFVEGLDGRAYFAAIEGAGRCLSTPAQCELPGVRVNDRFGTVTFELTHADPDFVAKLALPYAALSPGGEGGFAGAGPYRVTSWEPGREIGLERNPHYSAWASGAAPRAFPDAIEVRVGAGAARRARMLAAGNVDVALGGLRDHDKARLAADGRAMVRSALAPATTMLVLDARPGRALADRRLREAVAFAMERHHLAAFVGRAPVVCRIVPFGYAGYRVPCPYTEEAGGVWSHADELAAAERVREAGAEGTHLEISAEPALWSAAVASTIVEALGRLGLSAEWSGAADAGEGWDIRLQTRRAMLPTAAGFVASTLACAGLQASVGVLASSPAAVCPPTVAQAARRAVVRSRTDPAQSPGHWSAVDEAAIDEAVIVPLFSPAEVFASAPRVGDHQIHPVLGLLFDQLWVR